MLTVVWMVLLLLVAVELASPLRRSFLDNNDTTDGRSQASVKETEYTKQPVYETRTRVNRFFSNPQALSTRHRITFPEQNDIPELTITEMNSVKTKANVLSSNLPVLTSNVQQIYISKNDVPNINIIYGPHFMNQLPNTQSVDNTMNSYSVQDILSSLPTSSFQIKDVEKQGNIGYIAYVPTGIVIPVSQIRQDQQATYSGDQAADVKQSSIALAFIAYVPVGVMALNGKPETTPPSSTEPPIPTTRNCNHSEVGILHEKPDSNIYIPGFRLVNTQSDINHYTQDTLTEVPKTLPRMNKVDSFISAMDMVTKTHPKQEKVSIFDEKHNTIVQSTTPISTTGHNIRDNYLNELVDFVLDVVNSGVQKKGKSQIPLPDIRKEFYKRLGFIDVKGEFVAERGWFKDLSTLQRTADVEVSRSGNSVTVQCSLGLRTMQLGYEQYKAEFMHLGPDGSIKGVIRSNSLLVKVSISVESDNNCKIALQELKVTNLGSLDFDISGLGALQWLADQISSWITDNYKDDIIKEVETKLRVELSAAMARVKCGKSKTKKGRKLIGILFS